MVGGVRFLKSSKIERFLTARLLPVYVALIACVLLLPSLGTGWYLDDWVNEAVLLDVSGQDDSRATCARFYTYNKPDRNSVLMDRGLSSWWTKPDAMIDFFRPLSALTRMLDSAVAPGKAWPAHLHNLGWLALLLWIAARGYRRFLGAGPVAGLAALLFAVDEGRGSMAVWLADRSGLLCATFGLLTLIAHDRWRKDGAVAMALLAPGLLAAALLSAEGGIGVIAYLFAYAVFLDGGSRVRRFASLLPYAAVTLAWKLMYRGLGYGVRDNYVYMDPVQDPGGFLEALIQRWPVFVADQFFSLPAQVWMVLTSPQNLVYSALALGLVALLAAAVLPVLRGSALARFWATGSLLATVPICAGLTLDRALTQAAFGGAALVAMTLASWGFLPAEGGDGTRPMTSGWRRALGRYWVFVHVILAPLLLFGVSFRAFAVDRLVVAPFEQAVPTEPSVTEQTVVFVNGIESSIWYIPLMRAVRGQPGPRVVRLLAPSMYRIEFERTAVDRVLLRVPRGYHSVAADQGYRRPEDTLPVGSRVEVEGMTAEIVEHNDQGLASAVLFHFDVPLDDPSLVWRYSEVGGVRPFVLPAVGDSVILEPPFEF